MSDLPLQPDLRPVGRGWRWAAGGAVVGLLLALPWVIPERREPPQVILGGPQAIQEAGRTIERLIAGATTRVWAVFYVGRADTDGPVGAVVAALAAARQRGIDVQVVLDRERDGSPGKNQDLGDLLAQAGIAVIWDEPTVTTHAKVILADDRVWIGSHNLTRSALALNREAAVLLDEPAVADEVAAWFRSVPGFPSP